MPDYLFNAGDHVLLNSGTFAGMEGVVDRIDDLTQTLSVKVLIFGRPVTLSFELSTADEQMVPFGDQPPVQHSPNEDLRKRDLLNSHPDVDAIYQTHFWQGSSRFLVWICRTGDCHRIGVRGCLNLTAPIMMSPPVPGPLREVEIKLSHWTRFTQVVEACHFWELPYDIGRRIPEGQTSHSWQLEGYENEQYHLVGRRSDQPHSEISACCNYLQEFVENGLY